MEMIHDEADLYISSDFLFPSLENKSNPSSVQSEMLMGSSLVPHQTACLSRPRCSPRARTATHAAAVNVKVDLHLRECQVHFVSQSWVDLPIEGHIRDRC